jgi:hypothetical protein
MPVTISIGASTAGERLNFAHKGKILANFPNCSSGPATEIAQPGRRMHSIPVFVIV